MTPEQRDLLQDKLGIWRRQSEFGNEPWRDYNRRCAEALEVALSDTRSLRACLFFLNRELDAYWNGDRSDDRVKRIEAAQQNCAAALAEEDGVEPAPPRSEAP